jgi:hypothetical protein
MKCKEEWQNVQVGDVMIYTLRIILLYDYKMKSRRIQKHDIKNKHIKGTTELS